MLRHVRIFFAAIFLSACLLRADSEATNHPFLSESDIIQWHTLRPKYIEGDVSIALDDAKKSADQISSIPLNEVTFDNTIAAFERSGNSLLNAWSLVMNMSFTCDSQELRDVLSRITPKVVNFSSDVFSNSDLWARMKAFSETEEAKHLTKVDRRLMELTLDSFKDGGADLPREQKIRLKEIMTELVSLQQKFSENVIDSRDAWEVYVDDISELSGLSESTIAELANDAKANGHSGYRISSNSKDLSKFVSQIESENLFHRISNAISAAGINPKYDNKEIAKKILALRDEYAKILGYKTYADFALRRAMLKNGAAALSFIEGIRRKISKSFDEESREIDSFRASIPSAGEQSKQITNKELIKKHKQSKLNFNTAETFPYFNVENVINGMFFVANKLYGIKFVERKTFFSEDEAANVPSGSIPVWNKDVRYFDAFEETGEYIGSIYLDMLFRESKRSGAWTNDVVDWHTDENGKWRHPVVVICADTVPVISGNTCLLTQDDAEMLFHEFGHALHDLFSRTEYQSISSSVFLPRDFVEVPSIFMENFCRDRKVLDAFAKHYATNEPIPEQLFHKIMAEKNYMPASKMMAFLCDARADLELHQNYDAYKNSDITKMLNDVLRSYRYKFQEDNDKSLQSFSHIFSDGYAAAYYSYALSEALSADIFNEFKKNGVLSRSTGEKFRKNVLSKGSSEQPEELFHNFMGRDPDIEQLFIRRGLAK